MLSLIQKRLTWIPLVLLVLGFWWAVSQKEESSTLPEENDEVLRNDPALRASSSALKQVVQVDRTNRDERFTRYTDGSSHWLPAIEMSEKLNASETSLMHDLEIVEVLFTQYRLVFQENPVGTENFEFTQALQGGNPKKVYFLPPDSPHVNDKGQLLDRYGNPYRFHPLDSQTLEISSRGQDGVLWTRDDVKFPEGE